MYKFIKIRHDIIKQCHGNYKEMKKFNYKLKIGIFRNSTQKYLGVLRVYFKGLGVQKDALLAKTMTTTLTPYSPWLSVFNPFMLKSSSGYCYLDL